MNEKCHVGAFSTAHALGVNSYGHHPFLRIIVQCISEDWCFVFAMLSNLGYFENVIGVIRRSPFQRSCLWNGPVNKFFRISGKHTKKQFQVVDIDFSMITMGGGGGEWEWGLCS